MQLLYEVFNDGEKPWPNDEPKRIATHIRFVMPSFLSDSFVLGILDGSYMYFLEKERCLKCLLILHLA